MRDVIDIQRSRSEETISSSSSKEMLATLSLEAILSELKLGKIELTELDAQRNIIYPKLLTVNSKALKALAKKVKLDEVARVFVDDLHKKALRNKSEVALQKLFKAQLKEWEEAGFVCPSNYDLSLEGVSEIAPNGESTFKILNAIIWMDRLVRDVSTNSTKLLIKWLRNGKIKSLHIDRNLIVQPKKLAEVLCAEGTLFCPNNLVAGATFLSEFEAANIAVIEDPSRYFQIATKPGWVEVDDEKLFAAYDSKILFEPDREIALAQHIKEKGSFDEWLKVRPYVEKSRAQAVILASAIAPMLLDPLGKPGFIVDQFGGSSTGKTTSVCLAASAYGRPGGNQDEGLVVTWDSTKTYTERVLQYFSHMPIFCMDSHEMDDRAVQAVAYMVGNGAGRGRATKDGGVQERATFKSVMISDGEGAIYDKLTLDGGKARVISIHGAASQGLTKEDVEAQTSIFHKNYGHLAKLVIEHLDVKKLQTACEQYEKMFTERVPSSIAKRIAKHFAVVATAADAIAVIPEMHWFKEAFDSQVWSVFESAIKNLEEETQSAKALKAIADWITENQAHFALDAVSAPQFGCFGRIDRQSNIVAILGTPLREFLKKSFGNNYEALLKQFRHEKIVDNQRKVRITGKLISTFSFEYSTLFGEDAETSEATEEKLPEPANFRLEKIQKTNDTSGVWMHGTYERRVKDNRDNSMSSEVSRKSWLVDNQCYQDVVNDTRFSPGVLLQLSFTKSGDDYVKGISIIQ